MEPGGNMILRVAREDVDVEGTLIPAGAPVLGLVGAINRDPARFERADEVDIGRPANAQLTFGSGPMCASVLRWPGLRRMSPFPRCWTATAPSNWPASPNGGSTG